jgi:hypothetical protein
MAFQARFHVVLQIAHDELGHRQLKLLVNWWTFLAIVSFLIFKHNRLTFNHLAAIDDQLASDAPARSFEMVAGLLFLFTRPSVEGIED